MKSESWYHGSPFLFDILEKGSTVTRWRELAEAFSHKPEILCIEDDGTILHNGKIGGYLYGIVDDLVIGVDVVPHPRSTMGENLEYLTERPLQVTLIGKILPPDEELEKRLQLAMIRHQ